MLLRHSLVSSCFLVPLMTIVCACDPRAGEEANPDSWTFPEWTTKADELGTGLTLTRAPLVQVFSGYNHVVDTTLGRHCVLPSSGDIQVANFAVGADAFETTLTFIENRKHLEEALGVDAQAAIKLGPLGGGGSFGLSKNYKSSDRRVVILLRTRHTYTVINQEQHALVPEAQALLESDTDRFVRECGTGYIGGVAYGAELNLLIQLETSSFEDAKQLKAGLQAEGIQTGPATVDASLGSTFQKMISDSSATLSIDVEARGFVPRSDLNAVATLDDEAFALVAEVQADLKASVENDKCHDQGENGPGQCGGLPARGYLGNGARTAVPIGLLSLPFSRVENFPSDLTLIDAMLDLEDEAMMAIDFLEDCADLYRAMVTIHGDEVGAQMTAEHPFRFGVYDTSDAFRPDFTFTDLEQHVRTWAKAFEPSKGTEVVRLAGVVRKCWSRAEFGDFSGCLVPLAEREQGQRSFEAVADYASARVRPVYYSVDGQALEYDIAKRKCPSGWRLPSAVEASRLWFAVELDPEVPTCKDTGSILEGQQGVWFDGKAMCKSDEDAWIERLPSGDFRTGCHANKWYADDPELVVLCVPPSGIYGAAVPELPGE